MLLIKHKQSRQKIAKDQILLTSLQQQKVVEDTGEDPEELARKKLQDEAKYTRLHNEFESKPHFHPSRSN